MDSCDVHVGLAESVRNDSLPLKRFCKMQFPIMTTVNLPAIIDDPTPGHPALIPHSPGPEICQYTWVVKRPTAVRNSTAPTSCPAANVRWQSTHQAPRPLQQRQLLHWPPACHGWASAADADESCAGIGCYSCRLVTCCVDLWRQVTEGKRKRIGYYNSEVLYVHFYENTYTIL